MRITDKTTDYRVEPEERTVVTDRYGEAYEVTSVIVSFWGVGFGGEVESITTHGYKLTKSGERSKAAPYAMMIFGGEVDELETEALEHIRGDSA